MLCEKSPTPVSYGVDQIVRKVCEVIVQQKQVKADVEYRLRTFVASSDDW